MPGSSGFDDILLESPGFLRDFLEAGSPVLSVNFVDRLFPIHNEDNLRMASLRNQPHEDGKVFLPRKLQVVAAVPSLLVWGFLSAIAIVWLGAVTVQFLLGTPANPSNGQFAYIIAVLLVVVSCAWPVAKTFWRACQGRSSLWWHACTLGLGVLLTALLGIVGD